MEPLKMTVILAILTFIVISLNLVQGQVSSSCTTSMMSSFTPCANIITGSTNNGLVPSTTCCDSLKSLMSTNMDCACQVMSSNAPFFQQPINQLLSLSLSLSRACNINGASIQCKASSSPNSPAPGPEVVGSSSPSLPPSAESPLSPQGSKTMVVADRLKLENLQLAVAPAASMEAGVAPTKAGQIRPVLTPLPSSSPLSYVSFSAFAFMLLGIMVFGIH